MVNKKNILVTGANGQLGSALKDVSINYNHNYFFREKNELDITNFFVLENFLKKNNINTLINCAAYTNVNESETNKDLSNNVNHYAVENIAKLCFKFGIQLIHISTDYVFDGLKKYPYNETDKTNPINYYGKTKLDAERKILSYDLNKSVIIRTSWLYSKLDNNFVNKILNKLNNKKEIFVVDEEIGSPTNAIDLAETIMGIIIRLTNSKTEIYHFSNLGFCSRLQFANKINELIKGNCVIKPSKQNFIKIKRPKFSALDSSKIINDFQIRIKTWDMSLKTHLIKDNIFYND